jgi:hypothetical protein
VRVDGLIENGVILRKIRNPRNQANTRSYEAGSGGSPSLGDSNWKSRDTKLADRAARNSTPSDRYHFVNF